MTNDEIFIKAREMVASGKALSISEAKRVIRMREQRKSDDQRRALEAQKSDVKEE